MFESGGSIMKFGVCGDLGVAAIAAREAYDFVEWSVTELLKPCESESAFRALCDAIGTAELAYPVANCFVPGNLKITGPDVDNAALQAYVLTTMKRAEQAKVQIIVFGSGGARRIPEGFNAKKAHEQLVAFGRWVGPMAHDHGVTVVVEPLNTKECNVLTSVNECAQLVNEVAHPGIRLLVDSYHLMQADDSYDDIVKYGDLLAHVHIATRTNRCAPGSEICDFSRFFNALSNADYTGRVSIEASLANPETELPKALIVMRKLAQA